MEYADGHGLVFNSANLHTKTHISHIRTICFNRTNGAVNNYICISKKNILLAGNIASKFNRYDPVEKYYDFVVEEFSYYGLVVGKFKSRSKRQRTTLQSVGRFR